MFNDKIDDKIIKDKHPPLFLSFLHSSLYQYNFLEMFLCLISNQSFILQLQHIDFFNQASKGFGREKLSPKKKRIIIIIAQRWSVMTSLRRMATYLNHLRIFTRSLISHFGVLTSRVI